MEKVLSHFVKQWQEKVSKSRVELDGMPICPFAKSAKLDKNFFVDVIAIDIDSQIKEIVEKDFELYILVDSIKILTDSCLKDIIDQYNGKFEKYLFLKDHPDKKGYICGMYTGNGEYPVILIQNRKSLKEARKALSNTKYYSYWDEDYKNEIWSYE